MHQHDRPPRPRHAEGPQAEDARARRRLQEGDAGEAALQPTDRLGKI